MVTSEQFNWKPLSGSYIPLNVTGSLTSIKLLVYPDEPSRASETFDFSVSRLVRGANPKIHLIMLAGGPGQKGTIYLKAAQTILGHISGDIAVYMPSHRGTGKSGKPTGSDQLRVTASNKKEDGLPMESLTVENAAWDIVSLGRMIASDPAFIREGHRLSLYGCSYGGLWATRAVNLAPNLFDSLLMNSPFVLRNFWDPLNDRDLLASCGNDSHCNAQVNGNPDGIRNAISYIGNPEFNECTRIFHDSLASRPEFYSLRGNPDSDKAQQHLAGFLTDLMREGPKSAMSAVAFINHMYKCPNPAEFRRLCPSIFALSFTNPDNTTMRDEPSAAGVGDDKFGDGASVHLLVNMFVLGHELYELQSTRPPEVCSQKSPLGLLNFCTSYWTYRRHWTEHFADLHPKQSTSKLAGITSGRTKVIIFQGAMDTITAVPAIEKFYKEMWVPKKRLIVQKNLGHAGLFNSPCASYIFDELLGRSKSSVTTDLCMAMQNLSGPDWSLNGHPGLQAFWLKDPAKARLLPTGPRRDITGYPLSSLAKQNEWNSAQNWNAAFLFSILLVGLCGVIVASVLMFACCMRCRRLRSFRGKS